MLYHSTKGADKESEYDKLREEVNNKINEIKDKIYIPKIVMIEQIKRIFNIKNEI